MAREAGLAADMSPLFGISQRQPPCNLQAEQALLGAILANNKAFHRVVGFLKPEHFADPVHGLIYRECARFILRGQLVDAVTLKSVFDGNGALAAAGGTGYLAELLSAMVGIINAAEYGRAVYETWLRRELIGIGVGVVNHAFGDDLELDAEAQVMAASEALLNLSSSAAVQAPDVPVGDAARLAIANAEAWASGRLGAGLRSGLRPLDEAIGPLWPGWFYVLGARPGMGKSSLLCQTAIGVARQLQREELEAPPFSGAGGDVVIFSLEMPAEQMAGWMACQIAEVDNAVLQGRPMTDAEALRLLQAQRELDALPIRIIDAVGMSGPAMALRVRAMNARRRVRLVGVDHLQKVVSSREGWKDGETAATARTTSALKDLCRTVGCPVVVLAQLKRDVDQREDPRPRLSDLLYAGEADADVAYFLFRAERYLKKQPPDHLKRETEEQWQKRKEAWHKSWDEARGRAEIIVAKRRQGAEGVTVLRFDGPTTTFSEIGAAAEPDQSGFDYA